MKRKIATILAKKRSFESSSNKFIQTPAKGNRLFSAANQFSQNYLSILSIDPKEPSKKKILFFQNFLYFLFEMFKLCGF